MIYEIIQWIIILGLAIWLYILYIVENGNNNFIYDELKYISKKIQQNYKIKETIKVVKISPNAKLPYKGSDDAAGYDLCASLEQSNILIPAHETVKINTGLKMEIPKGYAGLIYARSGLATKEGLAPANKVGVVDSDYRGEIIVALHNHTNENKIVNNGDRIAQLVITPFKDCVFYETDELNETKRGDGGFGSTNK